MKSIFFSCAFLLVVLHASAQNLGSALCGLSTSISVKSGDSTPVCILYQLQWVDPDNSSLIDHGVPQKTLFTTSVDKFTRLSLLNCMVLVLFFFSF